MHLGELTCDVHRQLELLQCPNSECLIVLLVCTNGFSRNILYALAASSGVGARSPLILLSVAVLAKLLTVDPSENSSSSGVSGSPPDEAVRVLTDVTACRGRLSALIKDDRALVCGLVLSDASNDFDVDEVDEACEDARNKEGKRALLGGVEDRDGRLGVCIELEEAACWPCGVAVLLDERGIVLVGAD